MQPAHAPIGPGHDVAGFAERPALAAGLLKGVGQRHEGFEFLQRAHQRSAMRPRAGDGAVKVIAAGLGGKFGVRRVTDVMTEDGRTLVVEPSLVVIGEDIFVGPFSVGEMSHSSSPARGRRPVRCLHRLHEKPIVRPYCIGMSACLITLPHSARSSAKNFAASARLPGAKSMPKRLGLFDERGLLSGRRPRRG